MRVFEGERFVVIEEGDKIIIFMTTWVTTTSPDLIIHSPGPRLITLTFGICII